MPKVVVRTPFPTLEEVARTLRLSADEQAEVLERVGTKTGLGVRAPRADHATTKKGRSATRTTRRAVAAKHGRVRRAKK